MRSLIVLFIGFFLSSCSWKTSSKPSFLIVAIESLHSEAFYCGEYQTEFDNGLGLLCRDGVRFTHAYTPSTMSQPALASLLTALYPKDTGVWSNGPDYLSEKFQTVQEVAFSRGYRTSFFSGGPPIWRKSGLDQGFELFEDNLSLNFRDFYRPAQKNFDLFLNWQAESADGRPFFSVIFLSDLQFSESVTVNDLGQERARGYESQLKEIDESFANFATKLKQQRLWDNTYIFLVGLNGRSYSAREGELGALNLRSENTQVLMMIKPARRPRDDGQEWTIDANVSLVDLGATLYDLLGSPENISSLDGQLDVSSLKGALEKPQVDWSRERMILNESAWAQWRGVGGVRSAVRHGHILYIHDTKSKVFNTLTDRFENFPVRTIDVAMRQNVSDIQQFLQTRALLPWEALPASLVTKIHLARELWNFDYVIDERIKTRLQMLMKSRPWDRQVAGWLARAAIDNKDWDWLAKLGEEHADPLWKYVADRNRGVENVVQRHMCWDWLDKKLNLTRPHDSCPDREFIAFVEWMRATDPNKKALAEDRFIRIYTLAEMDERLSILNFQNGLIWDVAVNIPSEPRLVKLALVLPEYKGFRQVVEQRLNR